MVWATKKKKNIQSSQWTYRQCNRANLGENSDWIKISALYHYFEIWPWNNWNFEKIQNKFSCVQLEPYCVKISALYHYFEKMTLKSSKIDLLTLKKLKFWKNSKQDLMCSIRTVLCQNFRPLAQLWKMTLKFSKIDFLTLKKSKFWKNVK